MRRKQIRIASLLACAAVLLCALGARPQASERAEIDKLVADYVGLYAGNTLEAWKALFHPALTVASPKADGTIQVRGLEEFFAAQKNYFATGRRISERLENVRIEEGRRIARVTADFIFVDEGQERRGKLGLHAAKGNDGWKIVGIIFSYDGGEKPDSMHLIWVKFLQTQ